MKEPSVAAYMVVFALLRVRGIRVGTRDIIHVSRHGGCHQVTDHVTGPRITVIIAVTVLKT